MVISCICSTCWCMKLVFYDHQQWPSSSGHGQRGDPSVVGSRREGVQQVHRVLAVLANSLVSGRQEGKMSKGVIGWSFYRGRGCAGVGQWHEANIHQNRRSILDLLRIFGSSSIRSFIIHCLGLKHLQSTRNWTTAQHTWR
jgi:hypothetical protein